MEWPVKTKFGWPFLKLYGYMTEVYHSGAQSILVQCKSSRRDLGGMLLQEFLSNEHSEIESETTFNNSSLNINANTLYSCLYAYIM